MVGTAQRQIILVYAAIISVYGIAMGKRIELTDIYRVPRRKSSASVTVASYEYVGEPELPQHNGYAVVDITPEPIKKRRGRPRTQTSEQRKEYLKRKAKERRDRKKAAK